VKVSTAILQFFSDSDEIHMQKATNVMGLYNRYSYIHIYNSETSHFSVNRIPILLPAPRALCYAGHRNCMCGRCLMSPATIKRISPQIAMQFLLHGHT
jgi:hypothetical protein